MQDQGTIVGGTASRRELYRAARASPAAGEWPRSRVIAAVGIAVAAASLLLFRTPFVTPDSVYAMIWGRELAHGALSSFVPGPTPHPLPIALGAVTSVLGTDGGYNATYLLLGPVSLGGLMAALFAAGWRLGSPVTGALAVVVPLSSPPILDWAASARYDVAFAALVMTALALELARPRRGLAPLAALALAGLIRPEAWLVAAVYWLWAAPALRPRLRVAGAALVAIAPLLWMSMDAIVMGDPLWSLHYTQEASARLYMSYAPGENLARGALNLAACAGLFTVLVAPLALLRRPGATRRTLLPVWGLLALTLGPFLVLVARGTVQVTDLPTSVRYLLAPTCAIALLAAVAATRWDSSGRRLVVAAFTLLALQVALQAGRAAAVPDAVRPLAQRVDDVRDLAAQPAVSRMLEGCPEAGLSFQLVAPWAYFSGRPPWRWTLDERGVTRPDVYIAPATPEAARAVLMRPRFDADADFTIPPGMRPGPSRGDWVVHLAPASPCVKAATHAA